MLGPGRDIGVKTKTLLMHDMDKFAPNRFRQYSDWFFGPEGLKGTQNPELKARWRKTVDEHYANNLHHAHKLGKDQPIDNQLEALVDWYSVNKSNNATTLRFFDWWDSKKDTLPVSNEVKRLVEIAKEKDLNG